MSKFCVFISYSHKDEAWKDRLVSHLGVLQQQGLINLWDDRRIHSGEYWSQEVKKAMGTASLAILLVSPNFLTSEFVLREELPHLLELRSKKGLHVIPIIIMPSAWNRVSWLSKMKVFPKDGHPISAGDENQIDMDFTEITNEVYKFLTEKGELSLTHEILAPSRTKVSISRLPATGLELVGREHELELLDHAWDDPQTNIISLIGWGGMGKSALVNVWLSQIRKTNYRGAKRVYGWSFYSQGALVEKRASADLFIAEALRWFGDVEPDLGSPSDKAERLAGLISREPTLLILDGLESLQQYSEAQEGRFKDVSLRTLVLSLARRNSGLCVITSRLPLSDLQEYVDSSAKQVHLQKLSPEAGAQLLHNLGVKGDYEDQLLAAREYDGHALALSLLGRYLATTYEGDVRKRDAIAVQSLEKSPMKDAGSLLVLYAKEFEGEPELDILQILGLFGGPAEKNALEAVAAKPVITGLTSVLSNLAPAGWQKAIANLRDRLLLSKPDPRTPETLDCHPLIREHFSQKIQRENPEGWSEAHCRLYEYFKRSAREYPETSEEMVPLYSAVFHGCQAGLHEEVFSEVYWRRILRGNESYLTMKLAAFSEDLSLLSNFFEIPWYQPVEGLAEAETAFVLNRVGFVLRSVGRSVEAAQPLQSGLDADLEYENFSNAARTCHNLSDLTLILGKLSEALTYARQGVDLADRSMDAYLKIAGRTTLGNVLHQFGHIDEAIQLFLEAEAQQKQTQPAFPLLYSVQGFLYCDLLLTLGKCQDAIRRAMQTLKWSERSGGSILTLSLDYLTLGRSHYLMAQQERQDSFPLATDYLNRAMNGLRQAGVHQELIRGLIAQAALGRSLGAFEGAQRDLDEALSIATHDCMDLHLADIQLEFVRLFLAMDMRDLAKEHLSTARKLIETINYERRNDELTKLEELI